MITLNINNGGTLEITQDMNDGPINIKRSFKDETGNNFSISAGDFVTMLNWYKYQKEHNLTLEF